ncbi:MAG: hypothetical protein QOD66_3004 [Solirubrobacteraceae bacterium]|nr:hypothetical protein [Solirubrobacteraceae bacterium]
MPDHDPPGSLTTIVLRGGGLAGVGLLLTQIISLASYVVLARLAAPRQFGIFAAGSILVGISALFTESGMTAALIHRRDRLEEAAATAFVSTVAAGLGLAALALALAPVVGLFFHSHRAAEVAAVLSGILFLNATTVVPDALMQRRFSILRRMLVQPLSAAAFGISATIACANGMGAWGLTVGMYVSSLTGVVASWTLSGYRPAVRRASWRLWRELASYARHVVASEFLREASRVFSTGLVGRFIGPASLGQFRFALRLATQANDPVVAASGLVLFPAFSRISEDELRLRAAFLRALRFLSTVTLPLSLAFFPLGEQLAVVLFGERWRPAGVALMAMCGVGVARVLTSIATEVFKATGRPEYLPRMQLLALVLPALLMTAGFPFGLAGIGTGMSVGTLGVGIYAARLLPRVLPVTAREILDQVWAPAVAAVTMAVVLYLVEHLVIRAQWSPFPLDAGLLGVEVLLGIALYLLAIRVLVPARLRDLWALTAAIRPPAHHGRRTGHSEATPPPGP